MEHGPLLEQLQAELQPGQDEFDSPAQVITVFDLCVNDIKEDLLTFTIIRN